VGDPANREVLQRTCPGAIYVSWDDEDECDGAVGWAGALAIGPGLGRSDARRSLVERVLASLGSRPVVIDADGLSVFEGGMDRLSELLSATDVVTPHPGELAKLTGASLESILADPPGVATAAAEALGCTVLLKGSPSWVAESGQPLRVSTTGGPEVASGGTGDVLTGLIGAYLAVGMPAADAAAAALWLIGVAAGSSPEPSGHLASDIPDRLPGVRSRVSDLGTPRGPVLFVSER
jgi:NAD(P)H-hydrate epimerase